MHCTSKKSRRGKGESLLISLTCALDCGRFLCEDDAEKRLQAYSQLLLGDDDAAEEPPSFRRQSDSEFSVLSVP